MNQVDAEEFTQSLGQIVAGSWRQVALAKRLGVPQALGLTVEQWVQERIGGYVKMSVAERREAVQELTADGHSNVAIGEVLGVDETTVRRDSANAEASLEKRNNINESETGSSANAEPLDAVAADKAAATRTAHEQIAEFAFQQPARDVPEGPPIRLGDFFTLSAELRDASVDLIFTDPPYDDESIPLFGKMAEVAARVLKPGASLVTYLGHMQLLKAGDALSKHLRYWQPLCCLHSGPAARLKEFGVVASFKPMLWFVKGTRSDKHTFVDNVVTGKREKDHHEWQQAEAEAAYFIENLSPPSGLVVDFFAGAGTTIAAARKLDRFAIGYEIDPRHHASSIKRLAAQ